MSIATKSRKKQIELAATELFKTKGYIATTMRDIASTVGIEASSIYSHINSKEKILTSICFRIAGAFMKGIDEIINCDAPIEEKFRLAIETHVGVMTDEIAASAVFWNEWRHLSNLPLSEIISMQRDYESAFNSLLEQGVKEGIFEVHDLSFTVLAILSSLNGIPKWHSYTLPPEELKRAFSTMFLNGLKK